jgi:hypothetical protein
MFYRVAIQKDPAALWRWESRVIASLEVLMRVLWMYRSMSQYERRVFFASSVAGLDSMLDRETKGLASHSIAVEQLLQGKSSTGQSISQLEMRRFESELRTRESVEMLETSTVEELSLHEKQNQGSGAPSVTAAHFLHERLIHAPEATGGEDQQRVSITVATQSSVNGSSTEGNGQLGKWMNALESRRLALELGPGGDHDVPSRFVLPASMPPVLAWMRLLARIERGELHP